MAQVKIISHWSKLIENLQMSSLEFYNSVEAAIKQREVPETLTSRVEHHEGGMLSDKRIYLRVERENLQYDICAAPFGTGFFVSSWYGKKAPGGGFIILFGVIVVYLALSPILGQIFSPSVAMLLYFLGVPAIVLFIGYLMSQGKIGGEEAILATPILGWLYDKIFHPWTYYKVDRIEMYQAAIHNAVLATIDEIAKAKGLRPLTELERKPVMQEFVKK